MDFLLRKLIKDVSNWYDINFYTKDFKGTKHKKNLHLNILIRSYNKDIFKDKIGEELNKVRIWFLTDVQGVVDMIEGGNRI